MISLPAVVASVIGMMFAMVAHEMLPGTSAHRERPWLLALLQVGGFTSLIRLAFLIGWPAGLVFLCSGFAGSLLYRSTTGSRLMHPVSRTIRICTVPMAAAGAVLAWLL